MFIDFTASSINSHVFSDQTLKDSNDESGIFDVEAVLRALEHDRCSFYCFVSKELLRVFSKQAWVRPFHPNGLHWASAKCFSLFLAIHAAVLHFESVFSKSGLFLADCLLVILSWKLPVMFYAIFLSCLISDFSCYSSVFSAGLGLYPVALLLFCKTLQVLESYTLFDHVYVFLTYKPLSK